MAVQPNFPQVNPGAYNCARCYTMAQPYHSDPLRYCLSTCQNLPRDTLQCIQDQVQANPLVLPGNMPCVRPEGVAVPDASSSAAAAPHPPPQVQCLSQCLAYHDTCINQCRA